MVGVNFSGCGLMLVVAGDGYLVVICLVSSKLARFRFGCWRCWVCCGGVAATSWWVRWFWVHLIWVCCKFFFFFWLILGDFGMGLSLFWVWMLVDFSMDGFGCWAC